MNRAVRAIASVWNFYAEGFRGMTVGRKLWALILVKLVLFFLVLKLFFSPTCCTRGTTTMPTARLPSGRR